MFSLDVICCHILLGIVISISAPSQDVANAQVNSYSTSPYTIAVKQQSSPFKIIRGTKISEKAFDSLQNFSIFNDSNSLFTNGANIQNNLNIFARKSVFNINALVHTNLTGNLFLAAETQSVANKTQLEELHPGERVKYEGVEWRVQAYGTYKDPQGYQTQEWLLSSSDNQKRYLQKEYNPEIPKDPIHWYFSEEVVEAQVLEPGNSNNLIPSVWQDMQDKKTPQHELNALNRTYFFDFQTSGTYSDQDGTLPRITWDYWDKDHKWNLELEAFPNQELHVYSAQEINPETFSILPSSQNVKTFPIGKVILATSMMVGGMVMRHKAKRTGNL
ncbi:filamentous hemagglutinin outer membrane protein [Calothrix brevissima NIES-22]|nr:filamentous hemagglutinin outer membrane protein [Calothrix brevissima NIES-22]